MDNVWYRMANRRAKYHLAKSDWIRSGRGVCGADIRKPGYTIRSDDALKLKRIDWEKGMCKHCMRKVDV